jgi:UrcA family protein
MGMPATGQQVAASHVRGLSVSALSSCRSIPKSVGLGAYLTPFLRLIAPFHATSRANASGKSRFYMCVHGETSHYRYPEGVIMKSTAKRHALVAIATLAAMATANLATATPATDEPRSAVVRYGDLDLSRPADARRLYGRIKRAARAVCDNHPLVDFKRLDEYEKCLGQAVSEAVEKVQSEQVTATHRAHNGRLARS